MSKIELPPLPALPKQTKLSVLDVEILLHARDRQIVELCASLADDAEAGDGSHDYNAGAETMRERIVKAIRASALPGTSNDQQEQPR